MNYKNGDAMVHNDVYLGFIIFVYILLDTKEVNENMPDSPNKLLHISLKSHFKMKR